MNIIDRLDLRRSDLQTNILLENLVLNISLSESFLNMQIIISDFSVDGFSVGLNTFSGPNQLDVYGTLELEKSENFQRALLSFFDDKNRKNVALINICLPHELPFKVINERDDIYKIIYTKESPNIRHTQQWEANFLNLFDHILTYWNPLLSSNNSKVSYCPFIHRLDLDNEIHNNLLLNNTSFEKNIIMVLECRELSGNYKISKSQSRRGKRVDRNESWSRRVWKYRN